MFLVPCHVVAGHLARATERIPFTCDFQPIRISVGVQEDIKTEQTIQTDLYIQE